MGRPDFSDYLAHFTSDRDPVCSQDDDNPTSSYAGKNALERLVSILDQRCIQASKLPWVGRLAVSFTECPWASLLDHANRYSHYGLGFSKAHVFAAGGGPAYYVRSDHFKKQTWDPHLLSFVTPFWPGYRPTQLKSQDHLSGKTIDYSHEREWRIPHDFTFDLDSIAFVILKTYEDMAQFPRAHKDAIGRERFLIMDQYRAVEAIWPVHKL